MAERLYVSTTKPDSLASAISGTDSTMVLTDGSTFPDPALAGLSYTVIIGYGTDREEVALVTAKPSANTFTLLRGQDSTAATPKNVGDVVVHGVSAQDFNNIKKKVDISGDTMTGLLVLSGDPVDDAGATTKHYVDAVDITKVNLAGDTMTGRLILMGYPISDEEAATKRYVDDAKGAVDTALLGKVSDTGDTMTGPLVLPGNPTLDLQAAPKQYVDTQMNTRVSKTGDAAIAGDLTLTPSDGLGLLKISGTSLATIDLDSSGGGVGNSTIHFLNSGRRLWSLLKGLSGDFVLSRYDDTVAGNFVDSPIKVSKTTGAITLLKVVANPGEVRLLAMTTQTIPNGGAFTKVTGYLVQTGDTGNTGDLVYSNGNLTSATGGYYDVSVATYWNTADADAKNGYRAAQIEVNGSRLIRVDTVPTSTGAQFNQLGMNAVYLPPGGVLSTGVYQNSGGTLSLDGARWHVSKVHSL